MITVLDAQGNDVTTSALITVPPNPSRVPPEELDDVPYGSRIATRRQQLLQALNVQVWWHSDQR